MHCNVKKDVTQQSPVCPCFYTKVIGAMISDVYCQKPTGILNSDLDLKCNVYTKWWHLLETI